MRRRWWKFAIPIGLAVAVLIGTGVMHAIEEPSRTDPAYLSPGPAGVDEGIGAGGLADRLRARGISVVRETHTSDALLAAYKGNATLFIPAPGLLHWRYLQMISLLPSTTRVVLVEPGSTELDSAGISLDAYDTAWATQAPPPTRGGEPCTIPGAQQAGPAAVTRTRYEGAMAHSCYQGGLAQIQAGHTDVVSVGSGDIFRNDRLLEHDNATLAVGLLSQHPTLYWLDLHNAEPGPLVDENANPNGQPMPPSLAPGNQPGDGSGGTNPGRGQASPPPGDNGEPGQNQADSDQPSMWSVFPAALWAMLVGTLAALLLLALWRARRLGQPIGEPLAVSVKGSETLLGRARLYRRAVATGSSLETLRRSLRPRIASEAGLSPSAQPDEIADAVIERLGDRELPLRKPGSKRHRRLDRVEVLDALAGAPPTAERDLVYLARLLEYIHLELRRTAAPRTEHHDEGEEP